MEKEVLIIAEGVSKKFCRNLKKSLIYGGEDIVKGFFGIEKKQDLRADEFWAVNDVNFEVRRGECLGLIGHNGAGKSTLLKMLNGLIRPDKGRIEMHGKVGALIELGAGFNSLLTGRENVYINGAVLGFTKQEIDQKFDEIVDFSELTDFIDTPVQNYSSGMKVRLGFAVAAQMAPDILLIDEVLAVGDMGFVLKCFNHMDKLLKNTAIILVSHSIPQVARMATQLVIMERGVQKFNGSDISDGINLYYSNFGSGVVNFERNDKAELVSVKIQNTAKELKKIDQVPLIDAYAPVSVTITIKSKIKIFQPSIYLAFYDKEQRNFAEVNNFIESNINTFIEPEKEYTFQVNFNALQFAQGIYSITIALGDNAIDKKETIFRIQSAISFQVNNQHHGWAPIQFLPKWQIE
jgi:lipopolysaccharide transport system ATP-binding protein